MVNTPGYSALLSLGVLTSPYDLVMMANGMWNATLCASANCSGRGECTDNGDCQCEIQFVGSGCADSNIGYYAGFATVFFLLAAVCLGQLVTCVVAEFRRMKVPSIGRACRVTTQKLLYFVIFLAATLRGVYFASPEDFLGDWSPSLLSAFYPIMLTGASLLVCFWAEVFHLRDIRWERSRFLSKSFLGFVTFNLLSYSLLLAECALNIFAGPSQAERSFYTNVFNGCYAVLMFIVVIFFLIYGVEVYFKVRGGFIPVDPVDEKETLVKVDCTPPTSSGRPAPQEEEIGINSGTSPLLLKHEVHGGFLISSLDETARRRNSFRTPDTVQSTDASQLHQSRLGLVSQASMLIVVIGFLCSEIFGDFWKSKVPVAGRNVYDVAFRVMEIGVALWFPCVLWNCMRPEQLWILNPKNLLKKLEREQSPSSRAGTLQGEMDENEGLSEGLRPSSPSASCGSLADCWICYDSERTDAGPLIQPCLCRGDVGSVHHHCLRRWLTESTDNADNLRCKVCNSPYQVEKASSWSSWCGKGLTPQHYLQLTVTITAMGLAVAGAWTAIKLFDSTGLRILAAGMASIVVYVCLRFLGLNTLIAYQRGKVSSLSIVSRDQQQHLRPPAKKVQPSTSVSDGVVLGAVSLEVAASGVPKCPVQTRI